MFPSTLASRVTANILFLVLFVKNVSIFFYKVKKIEAELLEDMDALGIMGGSASLIAHTITITTIAGSKLTTQLVA